MTGDHAEQIYQAYSRHQGKIKALPAIKRAGRVVVKGGMTEQEAFEFLLERTQKFAASKAGQNFPYVKYPEGWFNAGHYLDDEAEWGGPKHDQIQNKKIDVERQKRAEDAKRAARNQLGVINTLKSLDVDRLAELAATARRNMPSFALKLLPVDADPIEHPSYRAFVWAEYQKEFTE